MDDQPSNKKPKPPQRPIVNWVSLAVQIGLALLLVYVWQAAFHEMNTRAIAYSQFKDYLAKGEVTQCKIGADEISGVIKLKEPEKAAPVEQKTAAPPAKPGENAAPAPPQKTSPASPGKGAETPATPAENSAATPEKPGEKAAKPNAGTPTGTASENTFAFTTTPVPGDTKLVEELEKQHVLFTGERPSLLAQFFWNWIVPLGLMVVLWLFISRRFAAAGQSVLGFGKSKARLASDKNTGVTFDDVAGCDEAKYELQEVVDFLKHPRRYRQLGAKIPKGVLLVGPPGTGKTLLARAVAGEARVPFYSLSGSEFVEMFVGVGAARVRDMFDQAKANAPCILFIDELDAIGRQRGIHIGNVNDEREQTLNQLLVGMDGFEENIGVILLAATNRPEVLDRALLRPGRFDRQIVVDAPDLNGREAILKVHAREKKMEENIDLREIARATPGLSGADLANILNEAALLAARHQDERITQADLQEAVEKVVAGPERKSRRLGDEERHRVAYHEVGHALVAAYSPHADPVHKISIVPHGRMALGYTMQLPTEEQFLTRYSELLDKIKGMLGGRAAEDVVYHESSTGAENDLERATSLARQMVCLFGMSDKIGPVHCALPDGQFLTPGMPRLQRDCSEETAREIDEEVKRILLHGYDDAKKIIQEHRDQLDRVADELFQHEVLDAQQFGALIGRPVAKH